MSKYKCEPLAVDEESVIDLALRAGNENLRKQLDLILSEALELANFEQQIPQGAMIMPGTGPKWSKLQERIKEHYGTPQAIYDMYTKAIHVRNTQVAIANLTKHITVAANIQKVFNILDDTNKPLRYISSTMLPKDEIIALVYPTNPEWNTKNLIGYNILSTLDGMLISINPNRDSVTGKVMSLGCTLSELVPIPVQVCPSLQDQVQDLHKLR
jgi:hypothetical protein